jgi:hypothetical protein
MPVALVNEGESCFAGSRTYRSQDIKGTYTNTPICIQKGGRHCQPIHRARKKGEGWRPRKSYICVAIKAKALDRGCLGIRKTRLRRRSHWSDNTQPLAYCHKLGQRAKTKYTVIIRGMCRVISAPGLFDWRYRPATRHCMKISTTAATRLITISDKVIRP